MKALVLGVTLLRARAKKIKRLTIKQIDWELLVGPEGFPDTIFGSARLSHGQA